MTLSSASKFPRINLLRERGGLLGKKGQKDTFLSTALTRIHHQTQNAPDDNMNSTKVQKYCSNTFIICRDWDLRLMPHFNLKFGGFTPNLK